MKTKEEDLHVQSSDMALTTIVALENSGSLDLGPRYQRRNRWDRERQSQLIESFLLNVPVPPIYLAEEARGIYAVIDGKQRLTAIIQFFKDEFPLSKLQLRNELEGSRYSGLNNYWANTLQMRPLRTVTIMRQTPDWVKHEVFLRLNRGGQPLNAQEIRNVAFAGPLNDAIIELATHPFLRRQLKIKDENSASYADMSDVETVVRFFATSRNWKNFGGDQTKALDRFMLETHTSNPSEIGALEGRFIRAIEYCERLWGENAFQRFDGMQWRDQMIGGVYDAQMVAVDLTDDDTLERIAKRPVDSLYEMGKLFNDAKFDSSVRISTNSSTRVRYRIKCVTDLLKRIG